MWATCLNEPAVGPEIMDLSILPPFPGFFFLISDDLGLSAKGISKSERLSLSERRCGTGSGLVSLHSFVEYFGFTFIRKDESNRTFLSQGG